MRDSTLHEKREMRIEEEQLDEFAQLRGDFECMLSN